LLIVILFLVGLTRRTSIFVLTVVGLGLFVTAGLVAKAYLNGAGQPANMSGYLLIICFLTGIAFYKLRAHILWDSRLAIGALLASLLLLQLPVVGDALSIVPIGYLTVFLGVMNMRKIGLLKGADYSYGVFLYGYVIQQAYMTLGPAFHHWYINIALSLPTAALFAAFSWHLVEKPALKGRRPLMALEDRWIAYRARMKKLPEPEGTI
jgi:peptidoglycan/LPS O-acetylase OafA/YrhL